MTSAKSILTLASCENIKIYRQRKYQILPVITALIIIAGAAVSIIPGNVFSLTMANYPYTVLSLMSYILAPLTIFMLVSDLLSGEIAGNEIKVYLTRPVSRVNALLAKTLAVTGYAGILLAEGLVLSGILSIIFAGFASFSIISVLAAYLVGFLPLVTMTAMSAMVASMMKSATSCFSFCLLAYAGFSVLGLVFSNLSPVLFTSYLGIGSMVIGSVVPVSSLLTGIAILIGYALTFLAVSGLKFADREI